MRKMHISAGHFAHATKPGKAHIPAIDQAVPGP